MKIGKDRKMLSKIMLSLVLLGLSSHGCLAQTQKPSSIIGAPPPAPLDISPWLFPYTDDPLLFTSWTTPVQARDTPTLSWDFTALTLQLSGIQPGMSYKSAILWIQILGGMEDGGLQTIPASRYYFVSGITVYLPHKDGYVTGPVQIAPGYFHSD